MNPYLILGESNRSVWFHRKTHYLTWIPLGVDSFCQHKMN